ncbi:unnamed protein product, partial [Adineta steineri]
MPPPPTLNSNITAIEL